MGGADRRMGGDGMSGGEPIEAPARWPADEAPVRWPGA